MTAAGGRRGLDLLRLALGAVILCYVWRIQDLVPGLASLKVPTIVTAITALLLLVDGAAQRQLGAALRHRVGRLMPWFALVAAVSVVESLNVGWSLDYFVRDFLPGLALIVIVPAGIFRSGDARIFAAIQMLGAAFYCCAILLMFDVGADGRLGSLVFYDGNDIGMLLVCTLPICVYFIRHAAGGAGRLLALGVAALFMLTIARTGSRGAFLGLIAVGAYVLLRFRTVQSSVRLAVTGLAACVLVLGASTKYWTQMESILHPTTDYNWSGNDDLGRMSIWRRGIGYAEDRPVTGVGIAAFNIAEGTISPLARRQEYGKGLKWSSPHNSFVQVLAELGVPGLLLFLAIMFAAYRTAARLARLSDRRGPDAGREGELARAHAASLVGFTVSGFFLSQAYAPYLYFAIGMIIGLDVTVRTEWREEDAEFDAMIGVPPAARAVPANAGGTFGSLVWS